MERPLAGPCGPVSGKCLPLVEHVVNLAPLSLIILSLMCVDRPERVAGFSMGMHKGRFDEVLI